MPNDLFKEWLTKHYAGVIGEAMGELKQPNVPVPFISNLPSEIRAEADPIHLSPDETATFEAATQPALPGLAGLNPRYN